MEGAEFDLGLLKQRACGMVYAITFQVDDLFYPGIDYHLRAKQAGTESRIEDRVLHSYSVVGRLYYRVFFAVTAKAFSEFFP